MNSGKTVFAQLMEIVVQQKEFQKCVQRYRGDYKVQKFSCWDQFLTMSFAQLTYRESLRDIETCLSAQKKKLYHMGISSAPPRSTIAYANETRDWRIYADFANYLIQVARPLYADDEIGVALKDTVYALDSTTIDLSIGLFPWARFRKTKAAVKMHTLLDLHGPIPSFIDITDGKVHDVNILDELPIETGAFYIMDRAYLDFARLFRLEQNSSFFVIRSKRGFQFDRISSRYVDKTTGLRCDQTILLKGFYPKKSYPFHLRRVKYFDKEEDRLLTFLSNNFCLHPILIAELYRCRWQIELFFKWIKQHLRIKAFYGTSQNAVKTQIWIAVSIYVIVAIMKKRLGLEFSMYKILQILSLTLFEKVPLHQLFTNDFEIHIINDNCNQLEFNFL